MYTRSTSSSSTWRLGKKNILVSRVPTMPRRAAVPLAVGGALPFPEEPLPLLLP